MSELVTLAWLTLVMTILGLAGVGSFHIILETEEAKHGRCFIEDKRPQLRKMVGKTNEATLP